MKFDYKDSLIGVGDGISSKKEGFINSSEEYEKAYLLGVRIAAGSAGLTVKEANLIKMLGGFIISDDQKDALKRRYLDCLSQLGSVDENFTLAELGGANEAI